jgi:DNA-binding GntR family transcriptional regulator
MDVASAICIGGRDSPTERISPMKRSLPSLRMKGNSKPGVVKPVRLTDQVSDVIKHLIFSGDLNPGDRVVEQKIARELGVGQNAVREALIELSHMGYVRRVPNIGTFVTKLGRADAEKISQVRTVLEGLVVDLVAQRLQSDDLDFSSAGELLQKMRKTATRGDIVTFYDYDLQFHRLLWGLADNEYLSQLLEQIVVPLFAFFLILNNPPERTDYLLEAVDHHENVLRGLVSHSPQKAHAAICGLMEISLRQQREIISEKRVEKSKTSSRGNEPAARSRA